MQSPSHIARAGAVCCATPTRAHLSGASPYLSKLRGRFPLQGYFMPIFGTITCLSRPVLSLCGS